MPVTTMSAWGLPNWFTTSLDMSEVEVTRVTIIAVAVASNKEGI